MRTRVLWIMVAVAVLAGAALACGSGGGSSEITNASFQKVCKGEEVELAIELYNTSYEAVLRNARTAEEYDTATFVAESDGACPDTAVEFIDQDLRIMDAPPGAGLVPFLEPWVVE